MGFICDFLEDHAENTVETVMEHPFLIMGAAVVGGIIAMSANDDGNSTGGRIYGGQFEEQQEKIRELETELSEKKKDRKIKKDSVEKLIRETEKIQKKLEGYRHELFLPGCIFEVQNYLEIAKALVQEKDMDAAFPAAENAFHIAELREIQLKEYELEWEKLYKELLEKRGQAEWLITNADQWDITIQTDAGNEYAVIDMFHWSGGRLAELNQQLDLREVPRQCPTADLEKLLEHTKEILIQMEELSQEAVEEFLDSQQRLQMCEAVYGSLLRRGWRLEREDSYGYEDDDDRNPVYLHMESAQNFHMDLLFSRQGGFSVITLFRGVGNRNLQESLERTMLDIFQEDGFLVTEFHSRTELEGEVR